MVEGLGQENYRLAARKVRHPLRRPEDYFPASRLRYYAGLTGCLVNGLPLYLFAYAPQVMPGGASKYLSMALADLVFLGSLFFAGGELWEKIRRIFVWEYKD